MKLRLLSEHHGELTRRRFTTPVEAAQMRFWRRAVAGSIVGLMLGWYGAIEVALARQATRTVDELEAREEHWSPSDGDDGFVACVQSLGVAPTYDFSTESKDCAEVRAGTRRSGVDPGCALKLAAVEPYAERALECAWPIPRAPQTWFASSYGDDRTSTYRHQSVRVGAIELVMAAHDAHDAQALDHWCSRLIALDVRLLHSYEIWMVSAFKPALSICEEAAAESGAIVTREAAVQASALAPDDADAVLDLLTLMRAESFGGLIAPSRREHLSAPLLRVIATDRGSGMPLDDLRWLQRQRNFSRFTELAVQGLGGPPDLIDRVLADASIQSHSGRWWLDDFDGSPERGLVNFLRVRRSDRGMLRSIARASSTEPLCQSD